MAGTRTIGALWRNAAARGTSSRPPYLAERDGAWVEVSWPEAAGASTTSRTACSPSGSKKGDAFAILASTSLEWCLFDFALGLIGAIGAPVYANSSPHDAAYVIGHSEAVGVLVEDDEQLAKIDGAARSLRGLRHVLTFAGLPELEARGREHAAAHPEALDRAPRPQVDEDDLFTYIYTSGTTGPPKGCMIRHRNYYEMAAVRGQDAEQRFVGPDDTLLLYLPLAHNYGRLIHLQAAYVGLHARASAATRCASARRSPRCARPSSRACRASTRRSTPRSSPGSTTPPARSGRSANWALRVGREVSRRRQAGEPIPRSPRAPAPARRPARLLEGEGALGGRLRARELGRRAALARGDRALRRARPADLRGLRPDRVHDRLLGQPARRLQVRHGRQAAPGRRGAPRRGRRAASPEPDRLRRLPQGPEATREVLARGRLAAHRRHRRDRRRTASSRSPTARRTSSSPPAARTSRPEPRERPEGVAVRLAGDRRSATAGRTSPRWSRSTRTRSRSGGPTGGEDVERARPRDRRRGQRAPLTVRADQALRDAPARLLGRGGRDHADAEAAPPRRAGALRGHRAAVCPSCPTAAASAARRSG